MKGRMQWSPVYCREDFASSGARTRDSFISKLQRLLNEMIVIIKYQTRHSLNDNNYSFYKKLGLRLATFIVDAYQINL